MSGSIAFFETTDVIIDDTNLLGEGMMQYLLLTDTFELVVVQLQTVKKWFSSLYYADARLGGLQANSLCGRC